MCEEIGDSKFCIIVGEAHDDSKKDQMFLMLRFVDNIDFILDRFFDVTYLRDTTNLIIKEEVCDIISWLNLDVSNIRGQEFDGASNTRWEWNSLQAIFVNDCPYV